MADSDSMCERVCGNGDMLKLSMENGTALQAHKSPTQSLANNNYIIKQQLNKLTRITHHGPELGRQLLT